MLKDNDLRYDDEEEQNDVINDEVNIKDNSHNNNEEVKKDLIIKDDSNVEKEVEESVKAKSDKAEDISLESSENEKETTTTDATKERTEEVVNETQDSINDTSQKDENTGSIKSITKRKNFLFIGIGAILAIIIVIFASTSFLSNKKVSVIKLANINFEGYNGYGIAKLNENELKFAIGKAIAKKLKIDDFDDMDDKGDIREFFSKLYANIDPKMAKFIDINEKTSIDIDKSNKLSNGDIVTVSIKFSGDEKDSAVKLEKKEFTVSGLKDVVKIKASDVLKEHPVKFQGINGAGYLVNNENFVVKSEAVSLSNGEKVKLKLSNDFEVKNNVGKGVIIEEDTVEVEVSGLTEVKEIKGLNYLSDNFDAIAKDYDSRHSYFETRVSESTGKNVIKVNNRESVFGGTKTVVTFKRLYKVSITGTYSKSEVRYVWMGYEDVALDGDSIINKNIQNNEDTSEARGNSVEDILAIAKKDGYQEIEVN